MKIISCISLYIFYIREINNFHAMIRFILVSFPSGFIVQEFSDSKYSQYLCLAVMVLVYQVFDVTGWW